jgi:hypothetical protein
MPLRDDASYTAKKSAVCMIMSCFIIIISLNVTLFLFNYCVVINYYMVINYYCVCVCIKSEHDQVIDWFVR